MRLTLFLIALAPAFPAAAQTPPSTFIASKALLANIHHVIGHLKMNYRGCDYTRSSIAGGKVDRASCGLEVRKNATRANRVEFEMGEQGGTKVAEPGDAVRGPLARAMLYISQVYGSDVKLPLEIVWQWHADNLPEPWKVERAKLIAERTGLRNEWILGRE